jgi:hypothetical protein
LIKDLDIKPETLKQLQEALGNTPEELATGDNFPTELKRLSI